MNQWVVERTVILGPEAVFGEQDDIVTPLGAVPQRSMKVTLAPRLKVTFQ